MRYVDQILHAAHKSHVVETEQDVVAGFLAGPIRGVPHVPYIPLADARLTVVRLSPPQAQVQHMPQTPLLWPKVYARVQNNLTSFTIELP